MRYIALALLLLTSCACVHRPEEPPKSTIGWNPATMRCQKFEDGKYRGEFLPDERCADQPKPKALP